MAKMAGSNNRKRPYGLLLLLALGMAVMCAVVLHQLREGRVLSLLIQEREQKLATLQILLQKERENSKEMKRKVDDMKAKIFALRNQKMELTDKLADTRNIATQLKKMRTDLEAALVEKQIQVDKLTDEVEEFILTKLKIANLTSLLKQKEDEVQEMKRSLTKQSLVENSTAQNEKSLQRSLTVSEERKGEWSKFQINKDEVDLKAENLGSRNQEEAEKKLNYAEGNQTVGVKEVNGTEEGKGDAKKTEETARMERVDHANVEEINGQLKSPEGSELAAKNDSENAVKGFAKYENIIGSSSNQSQYDLIQKTQDVEGMKNFSFDNKSTTDFDSSDRKFSSSKTEMEGIKQVTDKNDKVEEDQRKQDDENSKAEGPISSSKDLQLQETEVGQSSQKDGDGFTETMQNEAGKGAKSIGQSETVENSEESATESKTGDEKQAESEGQSENAENLED
ncbi:intracellular protein transport protein USO1-like [Dendrobium catenatum]|uniref:Uncharacterized protein n=1 Tax=Dendrobium catenatum TaxID=906689 RepID=A0A2I0WML6_9ASPA|nr:intracellular protein transport protein USO1-like [Dendrobium catenatum]PKU76893.1 hypothetical protein MA16_Dca001499 [Dendrobium catenatum]